MVGLASETDADGCRRPANPVFDLRGSVLGSTPAGPGVFCRFLRHVEFGRCHVQDDSKLSGMPIRLATDRRG